MRLAKSAKSSRIEMGRFLKVSSNLSSRACLVPPPSTETEQNPHPQVPNPREDCRIFEVFLGDKGYNHRVYQLLYYIYGILWPYL